MLSGLGGGGSPEGGGGGGVVSVSFLCSSLSGSSGTTVVHVN